MNPPTWSLVFAAACPCGLTMTLAAAGIPDAQRPDSDELDKVLDVACVGCHTELKLPAIAIVREPHQARLGEDW